MDKPTQQEAIVYSDKTMKRHGMGAVPDTADPRDYEYKAVAESGAMVNIPDSMSVAKLFPREVWEQGDMGACTSFVANLLVAAARSKMGYPYIRPSWMATWYWTKRAMYGEDVAKMNVGASIREAVMSTKREGVVSDKEFPYTANNLQIDPGPDVLTHANDYQSLYFFRLDDYDRGVDVDFLLRCLAEGYPLSVALPIYDSFVPDYSTSFVPVPGKSDKLQGHHAMTIYGYYLEGDNPHFRVRNSWGAWGGRHLLPSGRHVEPGTCRIPIEYVRDFGYDCWSIRAVEGGIIEGTKIPLLEIAP